LMLTSTISYFIPFLLLIQYSTQKIIKKRDK
jgi:hypothetical protein